MLPPSLPNQSASGTFPGENGKIAFRSQRDGFEIYVMNADGTGQTRLTDNSLRDRYPSWSPDGTKIAFARDSRSGGGFAEIYVMNADGTGQTRLTTIVHDPSFIHGGDMHPSWSPDGTKIAFASYRDATSTSYNPEIYVMNADGSGITRLTNEFEYDGYPSWSPDGTKIAFVSTRDGNAEIYVMNADDGSDVTRLTNNPDPDLEPSWSPDGEKIAFGRGEIYIMNADGSGQTNISNNPANDADPSWSPDGEKIAFTSTRDGKYEIYVMNADGSGQTNISNNPANEFEPDWGPVTEPPEEDTTPPVLTVPENMIVEATSEQGAEVTYTVTAEDNVDGNATLEADGSTIIQDDVGGDIDISCEPASGSTFPIGNTTVQCSATDEAGNTATESFTVTVNPPSPFPPLPTPAEVIDELISIIQNLDNVPQSVKTDIIAALEEVSNILNDNNPDNDESACGRLDAFINQVNAYEISDTLTSDEADELRTQAEDIRDMLGC
jgi:TolB protein